MGRSGEFVTNLSGEAAYQSFKPSPLPPNPELNINSDIVKKLVEANRDLVRLDTAANLIPNAEDMNDALTDLERYMNEGDDYDPLIRIALIHYQFETIHPFLDGKGLFSYCKKAFCIA